MEYGLAVCAACGHINPEFNDKCFNCGIKKSDGVFVTQGSVTVRVDEDIAENFPFLKKNDDDTSHHHNAKKPWGDPDFDKDPLKERILRMLNSKDAGTPYSTKEIAKELDLLGYISSIRKRCQELRSEELIEGKELPIDLGERWWYDEEDTWVWWVKCRHDD